MKTTFMRPLFRPFIFTIILLSFSTMAKAQMYGTGMMGGMMSCPYGQDIGDEATSIQDDIQEKQEELTEGKGKLREAKSKQRDPESKMKSGKAQVEGRGVESE